MKIFLTLAALLSLSIPRSDAAVVISGDIGTGAILTISHELQFTVTQPADQVIAIVFDEWASIAGSSEDVIMETGILLKRGDEVMSWAFQWLIEGPAQAMGGATPNDILLVLSLEHAINPGDVLTLSTGTSNLIPNADFGPLSGNEFLGNAFLIGFEGVVLSNTIVIPEPGTMGIGAGLALLLLATRPKRASGIVPSKEE